MKFQCYEINEILCGLNIKETSCQQKICMMNRVLRDFYTYITGTKMAREAVAFSGSGLKTIQFPRGVKQIQNFYVKGDNTCMSQKCFKRIEDCGSCPCENLYELYMAETSLPPTPGQYYFDREGDGLVINANIPSGVQEGWVVYSRGPETITSITDKVCIDDNALVLLQLLIMQYYAEKNREIGMAQYYETKFNKLLAKEIENQERLPNRIIGLIGGNIK